LRTHYHENLAPASDVDLFLYGLNEEQAIAKIKQIETSIRDSILAETTTIRTKNAITIVSQYPIRHVQIVLRLYKSVSEILTGFDVDCSCVAFDGQNVWASPRALAAFMTQVNTIDLTRRSPSYENRLSKYSHRGFEIHWPGIDRARIDPTIFERSFSRVQGLARLLVLEKLPHPDDRDKYLAQRRAERGRPELPWNARFRHELPGNVKDAQPDDVAEWVEEDEVSNYHTVGIPYGPKYYAKKIEKLLFTKDLLLNAEWNKPKDRETTLHRHPAFFGSVEDVLKDCCGYCPKPTTDADLAAFEEESKIYISGDVHFVKDNPGRQSIGSFNPITDDDWTEMAYVGNTTRLCQAIVDLDLEAVRDWFSSPEVVDVNRRDHTGRTPLQLAVMCSTPEIVQCLIEHGARLVARLYNGMTALHLAAHRGEVQIVKDILDKSEANAEVEAGKEEARLVSRRSANATQKSSDTSDVEDEDADEDMSDEDPFEAGEEFKSDSDEAMDDVTEGSFVKVAGTNAQDTDNDDDPDVYDIDVLAWDAPFSPLHLAILAGHLDVIELLITKYGADVLLPVKLLNDGQRRKVTAAILSLSLAMELPLRQANDTVTKMLALGASYKQADMNHISALHYAINGAKDLILRSMQAADPSAFVSTCDFVAVSGYQSRPVVDTALITAIRTGKWRLVQQLIESGVKTHISFESFAQAYKRAFPFQQAIDDPAAVQKTFQQYVEQPVIVALEHEMLEFVYYVIEKGEDVNTLATSAYNFLNNQYYGNSSGMSLLDVVRDRATEMKEYLNPNKEKDLNKPALLNDDAEYLDGFAEGTYCHWTAVKDLEDAKFVHQQQTKDYEQKAQTPEDSQAENNKKAAIRGQLENFLELEQLLLLKGAKTFAELHPDAKKDSYQNRYNLGYASSKFDDSPYQTKLSFRVADLTAEKKARLIKLFEACWTGDVESVKSLCLQGDSPLSIAVQDLHGFSPFLLAAIRGHHSLAQMIVEIAKAQYQPEEKTERYRYAVVGGEHFDSDESDEDEDDDDDSEDGGRVQIHAELVDDDFTLNDVVALAKNVKSRVSPSAMVRWTAELGRAISEEQGQTRRDFKATNVLPYVWVGDNPQQSWAWFNATFTAKSLADRQSLVRFAIFTGNMALLKFLIKVGNELAAQNEGEDKIKIIDIEKEDFSLAVKLGRIEMIAEIIKATGFGFPLQKVFKDSGIKLDEKPKYYQGLSVHGKKREDWAEGARKGHRYQDRDADSDYGIPLLVATLEGNLEATEYFVSDGPLRRYLEFADSFKDDKRICALALTKTGIKGTLESWLSTRHGLALHMAVMSPPKRDGTQPVLDYLIERLPEALEVRSTTGKTPLQIAVELGRYYAMNRLIAAGANQATKDNAGRNLMHSILDMIEPDRPAKLRSIVEMLDAKTVASLLLERCNIKTSGLTPLAGFLARLQGNVGWEESLAFLLSLSNGKDLEKMDGAGEYPLHSLVRRSDRDLVEFIVKYRPGLLFWENATGMTVVDVVTTTFLRYRVENRPQLSRTINRKIVRTQATQFAADEGVTPEHDAEEEDTKGKSSEWLMYHLVKSLVAKYPAKRKLVSIHGANEVAKRLALQLQSDNEENRRRERLGLKMRPARYQRYDRYQEERRQAKEQGDEVTEFLGRAGGFIKWDEMVFRKTFLSGSKEEEGKDIEREYTSKEGQN
jgi:ankyrin repeat protein